MKIKEKSLSPISLKLRFKKTYLCICQGNFNKIKKGAFDFAGKCFRFNAQSNSYIISKILNKRTYKI